MVFHKVNAEEGEGPDLEEKYNVRGYPTFLLLNGDGEIVNRWMGYSSPEAFKRYIDLNLADTAVLEAKLAAFETEPTAVRAELLGHYHASVGESAKAVECFRKVGEMSGEDAPDLSAEILGSTFDGYHEDVFQASDVITAAEKILAREGNTAKDLVTAAYYMTALGKKEGDTDLAIPYLTQAMDAAEGLGDDPDLAKYKEWVTFNHTLYVEKDVDKALEMKRGAMPEDWMESAESLNEFAWWCFQNDVNLEEAEQLARKGVELAEPGDEKAQILDTVAEIANARGNPGEAAALIEQALQETPDDEKLAEQLQRFQELASGVL